MSPVMIAQVEKFAHFNTWVTESVMWAVMNGVSLKFGVQGVSAFHWFSRVNGVQDNGIRLYNYKGILMIFWKKYAARWMDRLTKMLKWLDTILGSHRSPMLNPHMLTRMCTSHSWSFVSKIYHTLGKISIVVHFSINGAVPIPLLGGPLDLWVQDLWQYCLWSH